MIPAALCGPVGSSAAVVVGLAGSLHCVVMCGGISAALSLKVPGTPRRPAILSILNQLGRIASYVLAGALVGAGSGLVQSLVDWDTASRVARLLAGLVLLAIATSVLTRVRPLSLLEQLGGRAWRHLAALGRHLPSHPWARAFSLGMLWGWLPCGVAYSMLLFAALSGSGLAGAQLMGLFGLGTLPALLGVSLLGCSQRIRGFRLVTGSLLLLFGVITMLAPFVPMHH